MAKVIFVLGLGIGLAILAIAITAGPQSSGIAAPDFHEVAQAAPLTHAARCTFREVALDEGYGISRKVTERVCPPVAN